MPILALAVAFSPLMVPPVAIEDQTVDQDTLQRVRLAGEKIKQQRRIVPPKGMTEEDAQRLKALQDRIDKTAEKLAKAQEATPKELLSELEKLAHEAETLAAQLGAQGEVDATASPMIEELGRHADTAELGAALRAQAADQVARTARELRGKIGSAELTQEQLARLAEAIDGAIKAADDQDLRSVEGQKLAAVNKALQEGDREKAAAALGELAEHFDRRFERDEAARKLEALAEQLRREMQEALRPGGGQMRQLGDPGGGLRRLEPGQGMPAADWAELAQGNPDAMQGGMPMAAGQGMPNWGKPPATMPGGGLPAMAGGMMPIPGQGMGAARDASPDKAREPDSCQG